MVIENELNFVRSVLDKCKIQNLIINPNDVVDERVDNGLRKFFKTDISNQRFIDFFPLIQSNMIYRIADVFLCRYIFIKLPNIEKEEIFVIGPYLNFEVLSNDIVAQCEKIGAPVSMVGDLGMFYAGLPVVKEESFLLSIVEAFAQKIWGEKSFFYVEIDKESSAAFFSSNIKIKSADFSKSIEMIEKRYEFENNIILAISQGNIAKAEALAKNISPAAFESRTSDKLRNAKNYCIIMNTLFRKAAEQGGVHPIYIDKVSSDFAKKIESITSVSLIPEFMLEIMQTYCRLVRRNSVKNYSPLVQKTIIKVENDLTADLSLNVLAKSNNVSPAYFSDLFKRETGQTLTSFVNEKRIEHAQYLLKNTSLQIQTVAQHSGILDLNYFCRVFKKITGKTPSQWRDSILFN